MSVVEYIRKLVEDKKLRFPKYFLSSKIKEGIETSNLADNFEKENAKIVDFILNQFKLESSVIHGLPHWRRVLEIGNYLASETMADIRVVNLFAYFHDAKRENEDDDLEHGKRASIFLKDAYDKKLFHISRSQLDKLLFACEHHTNSRIKSGDITIQTCWDADRLDLWRLGIKPEPFFLNTEFAKQDEVIDLWELKHHE